MTNGDDIAKFEEEHFEALVEDFITSHYIEYKEYFSNSVEDGAVFDYSEDEDGLRVPADEDLRAEFCTEHAEWSRFVEIEYATRGAE